MDAVKILEKAQYVVDGRGRQTGVLLDLNSWRVLRRLLEELVEDEVLGELMKAVEEEEMLEGEAALKAYEAYLLEQE